MPAPLMPEITSEKMRPETTGAGIAYFCSALDFDTRKRPKKMTSAANPSVVRYSNWNPASLPASAAAYLPK